MPLIQSKSKKAFSKNVAAEMEHGKPQKQAIAIAYATKRASGKKKMAEGGAISAHDEKRPMPDNTYNDSKEKSHNSGNKAPKQDSWTDTPGLTAAQSNNGRMVKPIKRPSMVPSSAFSTRLYNEENMLEDSAKPGPYGEEPSKSEDEEGANRQGPSIPDESEQHNNHRKPYANGGTVDADHSGNSHNKAEGSEYGDGAEEDNQEDPAGLTEDNDQIRPESSAYMGKRDAAAYAEGGDVTSRRSMLASEEPIHDKTYTSDDEALEHAASIVSAVMAKRKMMADGGETLKSTGQYIGKAPHDPDEGSHDGVLSQILGLAKGGQIEEETTEHVPVTGGTTNNFGDAEYIVEHKSGSKKYFSAHEGGHEAAKKSAEEYRKRNLPKKYAEGGAIKSHSSIYSDDSDQADVSRNADEDANEEDQTSFNALRKENYSESAGLSQLDSPMDSNEDGRTIDKDDHDMVSSIRSKMKKKSAITR